MLFTYKQDSIQLFFQSDFNPNKNPLLRPHFEVNILLKNKVF